MIFFCAKRRAEKRADFKIHARVRWITANLLTLSCVLPFSGAYNPAGSLLKKKAVKQKDFTFIVEKEHFKRLHVII